MNQQLGQPMQGLPTLQNLLIERNELTAKVHDLELMLDYWHQKALSLAPNCDLPWPDDLVRP